MALSLRIAFSHPGENAQRWQGTNSVRFFDSVLVAFGLMLPVQSLAFQEQTLTGAQLVNRGQLEEALVVFRHDLELLPKSVPANNGVGVVLDLMGRFAEVRQYFSQAIKVASRPQDKVLAWRAMTIAWGFAGDCRSAGKYDTDAYELYLNASDFNSAGEVADEMGDCVSTLAI